MIGIFDSGFGGLTVLKAILQDENLKKYDYLYLGDNARAPYGSKSDEVIFNYTREAVEFLFSRGAELVILACNTASARALRKIQQEYLPKSKFSDRRVLGVIIPVAEKLMEDINNSQPKADQPRAGKIKIGIIGTRSTINSQTYENEINKLNKNKFNLEITAKPTPLLVPLIEENWIKRKETKMILKQYLRPLKEKRIDYLITGCTHYPLLLKQIQATMLKRTKILNTPDIVREKLTNYLKQHENITEKISKNNQVEFFTTDDKEKFKVLGSKFLGKKIFKVAKI